jgi:Sigma-70 region 2
MLSTPEPTDDALMTAYAQGDAAAFERLYARHQAGLYRFVRRLLGTALSAQVDEVFQDTWLRVVHARASWVPQGASFRTWLFTLAHHRAVDLLRKSGREVALDAFESEDGEPWQPEGAAWQHWPAMTWPSGGVRVSGCWHVWMNCHCRSAAPSCCTMKTACRWPMWHMRWRSASRPPRHACVMR